MNNQSTNNLLSSSDNDLDKKWYVIYTKPRAEKKLQKVLKSKQIETFLPLIPKKRKWSDRIKIIETPMFPSYIFVKIDYIKNKIETLRSAGAIHFIQLNSQPEIIDEKIIKTIKDWITKYPDTIKVIVDEKIKPGEIISVKSGSFAGYRARVIRAKNKSEIYMKIMGNHSIQIIVKLEDLMLEEL